MLPIDRFWKHVYNIKAAIKQSNSVQMKNWWTLRLLNLMLKLECYESKMLN